MAKIYTVNEFTGNIIQIAKHFGINTSCLLTRIKNGMSIEEAVNIPVNSAYGTAKIYTVNGFTGNIAQIAKHFEINKRTLSDRLNKGMSIEEAVNLPIKSAYGTAKIYTVNGFTGNITQIAKHFGINKYTLYNRLRNSMSIEEAVNLPIQSVNKGKIYTVNGFTGNMTQIAQYFGIKRGALVARLNNGFTIEEAVNYKKEYLGENNNDNKGED